MSGFADAIKDGQKGPPELNSAPFDPFALPSPMDEIARPSEATEAIPGMPEYALQFHSQRFVMGRELAEIDATGAKVFADRDESPAYQTVMGMVMSGEAVVFNRHQTIIGDGSVVIWLEWGVKKRLKKKKRKPYLTVDELRTTTPDATPTRGVTASVVEVAETPTEDEPDW